MKKIIIALIALVLMAGASIGFYLAAKDHKDKTKQQAKEELAENVLFNFDPYSPTKIVFSKGSESYTAEKTDDVWTLSNNEFALDQDYCQLVCTYLSDLKAATNYGAVTDEKLAMYGLDAPDKIELTNPSGTHTICIGSESPTGEYYYVTVDGKKNVYAVDAKHGSVLKLDRLLLKDKMIVPYSLYDIKQITTYKDGKVLCDLTLDTDTQMWSLPKEYSDIELDQTAVTAALNNLVRLEAEEMLDEKLDDLSKYGFDKPYGDVVVKGKDGSEHHILISANEDDPTYCFVLIDDEQVELYYKDDLDIAQALPYNYIVRNYVSASSTNVNSFKFSYMGNTDTCEVDISNMKCKYNGKDVDFGPTENYVAFNNFFTALSVLKFTGTDVNAKPELKDPFMTAEYSFNDGKTMKIDLVKGEDTNYYVFRDGKYIGAYVDETSLTGRNSVSEFYIKFKKLAGI
ncbi:DUF4340 domain-containing protein [Ruminococcus flavefaciens]|uniref:DUF4340 domain-containing protein n=1 Tax=Ruminococcus flavefaciens TaxID=1265 RepID=A0A1M7LFQ6_RUMFL|nr:DUF4340 domain-containing protein [Ruminococcus flavefaciens]SHM76803.1 protein of unknown function [Ruminococcus flavefaciens]